MVERLKKEYNVEVEWRPYYLRPDTPPEGMELPEYILKARANGSEERLQMMAEMHGMNFRSTERIYNTRIAHEATEYAREHGKANEFHHIVFRKVYSDGQDISKWDVLRAAAEEAGLDANDMQTTVDGGKYTKEVAGQVQWAQQIGVTGVPTYVINNKYAIVGAQPYEAFKNALAQIEKELKG
ncbi:MAG: DsbA family oxidoreductase [Anaerolineales bacterium]|nr:DsbA family oxidoreductase [Anaerolineales bacterium]